MQRIPKFVIKLTLSPLTITILKIARTRPKIKQLRKVIQNKHLDIKRKQLNANINTNAPR